jgi:hypothetical protein
MSRPLGVVVVMCDIIRVRGYHGTTTKAAEIILRDGFDISNEAQILLRLVWVLFMAEGQKRK